MYSWLVPLWVWAQPDRWWLFSLWVCKYTIHIFIGLEIVAKKLVEWCFHLGSNRVLPLFQGKFKDKLCDSPSDVQGVSPTFEEDMASPPLGRKRGKDFSPKRQAGLMVRFRSYYLMLDMIKMKIGQSLVVWGSWNFPKMFGGTKHHAWLHGKLW